MLKGLIAGLAVFAVNVVIGGFKLESVGGGFLYILLGVILDLALGRKGGLLIAAVGFAITTSLFILPLLLGIGKVEVVGMDPATGLVLFTAVNALYWAVFYGVYELADRYLR
ncbi:hypothetical protein [Pyrobaculum ferrireducens]|uniref:Uncharacterized protein n=1 Tax=Pyrobaculum ferrireducens TaxID=1104324 RepID=G7VD64_9CREN|nr:hypothetical protein [Pyrobaculum ferrireducens]AET33943.1 hypothetical protein P186_2559 [Pyrobaculum ferrireducens]